MAVSKVEAKRVPFYRNPEIIGKALDIITPDRTLRVLESIFHYEEEPGFEMHVKHYLQKGYWPVGVFSHFVLADAFAFAKAANRLTTLSQSLKDPDRRLAGCYALHQGTMENGSQGANVQIFTLKLEQAMQKQGMFYLPTINKDHERKYGLDSEEVVKINKDSQKKLGAAPKEKKGLLMFPAGNMEAARFNEYGRRKGMQGSNPMWIYQMAATIAYGKVPIIFVPGVIIDSFRISGPDQRDLTDEAYGAFIRNLAPDLLPFGLGRSFQAKLATLIMRRPYSVDRLALDLTVLTGRKIEQGNLAQLGMVMNSNKEITDRLIMGIIHEKMPDELGGDYYQNYSSFGLGDYAESLY